MDPERPAYLDRLAKFHTQADIAIKGLKALDRKLERISDEVRRRFETLDAQLDRFEAEFASRGHGRPRRRPGR